MVLPWGQTACPSSLPGSLFPTPNRPETTPGEAVRTPRPPGRQSSPLGIAATRVDGPSSVSSPPDRRVLGASWLASAGLAGQVRDGRHGTSYLCEPVESHHSAGQDRVPANQAACQEKTSTSFIAQTETSSAQPCICRSSVVPVGIRAFSSVAVQQLGVPAALGSGLWLPRRRTESQSSRPPRGALKARMVNSALAAL